MDRNQWNRLHFLWTDFVAEFGVIPRSPNQFMSFAKRWGETVTFQEAIEVISRKRRRRSHRNDHRRTDYRGADIRRSSGSENGVENEEPFGDSTPTTMLLEEDEAKESEYVTPHGDESDDQQLDLPINVSMGRHWMD